MNRTSLLLVAALAASASAQSPVFSYITPIGAEFSPGNGASDIMLGDWAAQTRTQQIDNNLVGRTLPLVRFLGFRRDGLGNVGAPKTTELTVTMSHADYATITSTFASNYKDQPVVVFARKPVNLPDWNTPVSESPAPVDLLIPFDVPFIYNAVDALLWDVQNENNPRGIYTQDWASGSIAHTYGDPPAELGGGCATANGSMNHRTAMRANATTFNIGFVVRNAPSSVPVSLLLGVVNPGISLPSLCGVLHSQPLVTLGLGTTNANGGIPLAFPISLPWNPSYAGATFFTQAVAPDGSQPGLPVAFSNGLRVGTPAVGATGQINVKRVYHTSNAYATVGTGPSVSAVITLYGF